MRHDGNLKRTQSKAIPAIAFFKFDKLCQRVATVFQSGG